MKFKEGDRVAIYHRIRQLGTIRWTVGEGICWVVPDARLPTQDRILQCHEKQLRRLVKKKKVIEDFKTPKGYVFQKTKSGWIDVDTGLEWQNEFKININHYDAEKWAKEQNTRLPTIEEFKVAEKHGIRELPDTIWQDYWFWSSTPHPYDSDDALVFYGNSGYAGDFYFRSYSYYELAARLVKEAK